MPALVLRLVLMVAAFAAAGSITVPVAAAVAGG